MTFGKRFSIHNNRPPAKIRQICARCGGTGHVRERGHPIVCKTCSGSGKVVVIAVA
jgi:DnaJ-class molecular chaperone